MIRQWSIMLRAGEVLLLAIAFSSIHGTQTRCALEAGLHVITESKWPILQGFGRDLLDKAEFVAIGNVGHYSGIVAILHSSERRTYLLADAGYFQLDPSGGGMKMRELLEIRGQKVTDVSMSAGFVGIVCEHRTGGIFWTAGQNKYGQLGHHGTENRPVFSPVGNLPPVKRIAIGNDHAVVLTIDNELYSWGYGANSRLGYSSGKINTQPKNFNIAQTPKDLCCGNLFCEVLTENSVVYTWGDSRYAGRQQPGTGIPPGPLEGVSSDEQITKISCTSEHGLVLTNDGVLYGWGYNKTGAILQAPLFGDNATALDLGWKLVYDMVAAGKTTIIQIYSGEMEVFGEDRSGSSTPPKAMEYARDVLAEARYGPNTWGPVRLLCEED